VGVKTAGKMVGVYAREGDVIHKGQVLAQQDTVDLQNQADSQMANLAAARAKLDQAKVAYRDAQTTLALTDAQTASAVKQAQAGLDQAQEQSAVIKKGARVQELQQSQDNLAAALADRNQARSDLKRYQDLYRQQAVSAQQLDQAQAAADSADARYNSAAAALNLLKEGNRPEDIRRAQAVADQAREQLVTARANRDQVTLRKEDVETAKAGIYSAEAGVQQAEATLRLAQQAVKDTVIRSPIDGVVAERKVEPGTQIALAKPDVMRIVSLTNIYFDAQLPETQYAEVRMGQPVAISVDAIPGRTFRGTVSKIFPVASSTARSFTVRIVISNEGQILRPQMFARGRIVLATHPHAVVAPRDAVLDFSGSAGRIFVVENGKAVERHVATGFFADGKLEIKSGLSAGEKVVTVGQSQLQNGDSVTVTGGGS
jgi:RND family efflux transporter MFP subunit